MGDDLVGRAFYELAAHDDKLDADLRAAEGKVKAAATSGADAYEKSYTGASQRVSAGFGSVRNALAGIGIGIGLGAVLTFFGGATQAASHLGETVSKTSQIMGKEALPGLEKWAEGAAEAFGQSKQQALDGAATFGIFGKSAGLAGDDLVGFSKELTVLASDFASMFDSSPAEAIEAIGAALRGESEPIRKYGVLLDEATLKQRALQLGIIETTTQALTPQQRVLAAQAEIFAQSADAQGDYQRTSGGLANTQRDLAATMANVTAEIGEKLLPIALKLAKFAKDTLLPALADISGAAVELAQLAIPLLVTALAVKLVTAFRAAQAAGIESATAVKLAWGVALLGPALALELARSRMADTADQMNVDQEGFTVKSLDIYGLWGKGVTDTVTATSKAVEAESARWAGNTKSFLDREIDELGRFAKEIPPELAAAGDAANAVIRSSYAGFSATLEDGSTIFAGSAELLAAELPHAMADAKARADAIAAGVPKDLAATIIGHLSEFDAARQAIIDAFTGAVSDAQAAAQNIAILSMPEIAAGFTKGSSEANATVLKEMDKLLTSLQVLQPAAFQAGTDANKALPAGFRANIDAAVAELGAERDKFAPSLSIEAFARTLGEDGLADYIAGMTSVDVVTPATIKRTQVLHELDFADEAGTWGRRIGSAWGGGLTSGLRDGLAGVTTVLGRYGRFLEGSSPPKEGPLRQIDKWGEAIGRAWREGLGRGMSPGALLGAIGGPQMALARAGAGVTPPTPVPGASSSSVEYHYHLSVAGKPIETGDAWDEIDALSRMAAFRDSPYDPRIG